MSLEIYLLGQFKLTANNLPIELPSRPAQSLLAYLALNAGAMHRREKLASVLWCDASESNGRGYLRQALWRIRKSLENAGLPSNEYLQISEISVTFNQQSEYWLDADQILKSSDKSSLDELIEEISCYRGELLPGFYDEWVGFERDRLLSVYHQKMSVLLERLIHANRYAEVLKWAEQWIRLGYSPESAYQALMQAHAGLGNTAMIPVTYQRCVEALKRELAVDPSPRTIRLYEQLRQAGRTSDNPPASLSTRRTSQPPFFLPDRIPQQMVEGAVFVAREGELEQLNACLDQVLTGKGMVIFVTGEAGSGKTSLVNEFTRRGRARQPDLIVAGGNCNAHTGIGDPYLPFREILELLTGDVESRWSAGAITKDYAQFLWNLIPITTRALVDVGPDLIDTLISGASLLERVAAFSPVLGDSPIRLESVLKRSSQDSIIQNTRQSDLFIQYSKVLQAISRQAPMLVILDDLQWADLGSISLLFHLGRQLAGHRIMILGAYRPEEITLGRGGERHPLEPVINELMRLYGEIEVNIDQAERRAFIDELLDSEPNRLEAQFREMLCGLTYGHPLFTVELLRGMQERGDLVKDPENRWIVGSTLGWETLPARVEAVIAERVNRLDPMLQTILRTASVEGELFTAEVIARVQSFAEAEILHHLSNELDRKHHLVRAQSIQRSDGQLLSGYRFRHILVQKYLYNSLDEVERVHLHERVGNALENLYAVVNRTAVLSPQLARHFQEAKITDKAINYLQQSGERALQVYAYEEAIAHLERGLALLASLPDSDKYAQQELALQVGLALAWHLAKGFTTPGIERIAVRALELCERFGNARQLCQVTSELAMLYYVKGDHERARDYGQKTLEIAQQADDPLLSALGDWCLGVSLFAHGDYPGARDHLEKVVSFYDPQHHHRAFIALRGVDAGLSGMAYLACTLWCLGYPEQARVRYLAALEMARQFEHAFTLADVLRYGGCEFHKICREAQMLGAIARELIQLSEDKRFPAWLATGKSCLGESLVMLGMYQEGRDTIEGGVHDELVVGVRCSVPSSLRHLAEAYFRLGDTERALDVLAWAFNMMEQTGEHHWEAEIHRTLAAVQHFQKLEQEAETSLLRAIELARCQHAKMWELRAAIDLARIWNREGKTNQGRQMVFEVYSWFTEGFNTPELRQARELLAGNSGSGSA